jgi:broad specificity phosphatase PhoE
LFLARHGEAGSNVRGIVNGIPPGEGLTPTGRDEARVLGADIAGVAVDLGVATEFLRTQETLAIALDGRDVPRIVLPLLNEIRFGAFDGGPLPDYRRWAWSEEPDVLPPGDGESRANVALRVADALEVLLARDEQTIVAVSHALPVRYILDAADGSFPAARIEHVDHCAAHRVTAAGASRAAETLRVWGEDAEFRDFPLDLTES